MRIVIMFYLTVRERRIWVCKLIQWKNFKLKRLITTSLSTFSQNHALELFQSLGAWPRLLGLCGVLSTPPILG